MCTDRCVQQHTCDNDMCGKVVARVEPYLCSNPLSKYYHLVMNIRSGDLQGAGERVEKVVSEREREQNTSPLLSAISNAY